MIKRLRLWVIVLLSGLCFSLAQGQSSILFPPQTTNPTCNGSVNGSIVFGFTGDSTEFFFSWSGGNLPTNGNPTTGNGIVRQTGLLAGTYSIFILDLNTGFDTTVQANLFNSQPITLNGGNDISNCLGQPITLSATSNAAPGSVYTWTFTNANGLQTLTGQSVVIPASPSPQAFTSTGPVNVLVTDPSGCTASDQLNITVSTPPVGQANPASQSICTGPVSIALTSNQPSTSFIWTVSQSGAAGAIPGSGSSINQNLRATGLTNGTVTYNIRPVSSGGCVGTVFQSVVTVRPKPTLVVNPDSSGICSGQTTSIQLSSSVLGSDFAWRATATSVTGASAGTGSSISQTLNSGTQAGRVVYRIAANAGGCLSDSVAAVVTVKPQPSVVVSTTDTVSVCSGQTASFTYSGSVQDASYIWTALPNSAGAVSGTGPSNSQTYTNPGAQALRVDFQVLSVADGCTSLVKSHRVRVLPLPVVTINGPTEPICSGGSIRLVLTSNLPGTNFTWTSQSNGVSGNTNGSGSPINQTLATTGNAPGTVTYSVVGTSPTCPGLPALQMVTVNPRPPAVVNPAQSTICSGSTTGFQLNSPVSGSGFSWTILPNSITGASAGTGNAIAQVLSNPGTALDSVVYTIQASFAGCQGNPVTATALVQPLSTPVASVQAPSVCSGENLQIDFSPSGNWNWLASSGSITGVSSGSGTSLSAFLSVVQPQDDSVTYKVFGQINSCPSDTLFLNVRVKANPLISVTKASDTICSGSNVALALASQPSDQVAFSWTALANNVTGASDGSGPAINQNLSLVSGNSGFVVYRISATRQGCTSLYSDTIWVLNPDISFTTTGGNAVCDGDTALITFQATNPPVQFSWSTTSSNVQGGASGSGNQISQILELADPQTAGFINYTVTPRIGQCLGIPRAIRVDVNPIPSVPVISISGGSSPICPGQVLTLTSDQVFGNQWYLNGVAVPAPEGISRNLIVSDSGNISLVFTSPAGCVSPTAFTRIDKIPVPPIPVITGPAGLCPGSSARLRSSVLAGNQWQLNGADITGATDSVFTATLAGSYSVRLTSTSCTVVSNPFEIVVLPAPPTPDITGNNFLCSGDTGLLSTGLAQSWQWLRNTSEISGATGQTLEIVQGGNYQVRISNENGCTALSNVYNVQSIPENPTPGINGLNSFCPGDSTILVTGNQNPAWKNQWYLDGSLLPNDTLRTLIGKLPGSYTVSLVSPRGCVSISQPFVVTLREAALVPVISGSGLFCPGGTTILTSSSSSGNIWFLDGIQINGANNPTYVTGQEGTYSVQVTNEAGCNALSAGFPVKDTTEIQVTAVLTDPTACGVSDGGIQISVLGGTGQNSYSWSPVSGGIIQGQQNQAGLVAGNYSVQIQDVLSGCTQQISGMILNDPAAFTASAQVTNVTSCSGSNGRINLTISGSNGPFTFTWSGPATGSTQNLVNIPAGFYTVQIQETSTGCVLTLDSIEVQNNLPPKPDIFASGPLEFCQGDSVILSTTAVGPYQWARVGVGAILDQTFDTTVVKSSGFYYVRTSNPAFPNCFSRSDTLEIIVNPLPGNPVISGGGSQICFGVSTTLFNGSTSSPQWILNGADIPGATNPFLEVTEGGTYCLRLTNSNGCSRVSSECRTITVNPLPPVHTINGTPGFCPGGRASLEVTPFDSLSYEYTWLRNNNFIGNQNQRQISVNLEGWYKIRVLNTVTNCRIFSDSVFVTNFSTPPAPTISGPGSVCPGNSAILVSSSAATYQWLKDGQTIEGATDDTLVISSPGVYSVSITDGNGCQAISAGFAVVEIAAPVASVISGENTFCAGSSVILTASPNLNYTWLFNGQALLNQTSQTLSASLFGSYQVVVTNASGCSDTSAAFVTVAGAANFGLDTTLENTSCVDGSPSANGSISVATLGGSGSFSYEWTPALPAVANQSGLSAGTYSVVVTDLGSGCFVALQNLVIEPTPVIIPNATITADSRCDLENGSIALAPSGSGGPYSFEWTGSSETGNSRFGLAAGTYEAIITDQSSGCVLALSSLVVAGVDTFSVAASITQPTSCGGVGLISLQATGGSGIFNYNWSGTGSGIVQGSAIQSSLLAGTYTVEVTDTVSKCLRALSNLSLQDSGNLDFEVATVNPSACGSPDGQATLVIGTPNPVVSWKKLPSTSLSGTGLVQTGLATGSYRAVVQAGTCVDSLDFDLVSPGIGIAQTIVNPSACGISDGSVTVMLSRVSPTSQFTWLKDGLPFASTQNLASLSEGNYQLYIRSAECFDSLEVTLFQPAGIPLVATVDSATTCVSSDGKITIQEPVQPSDLTWQWFAMPARTPVGTDTSVLENVRAGQYRLVAGNALCRDSILINIPVKAQPAVDDSIQRPTLCGASDGVILIRDSAQFATGQALWFRNGVLVGTGFALRQIPAGLYSLTISLELLGNPLPCLYSYSFVLPEGSGLGLTATIDSADCSDEGGSVALSASAPLSNPVYSWKKQGTPGFSASGSSQTGLASGTYTILVRSGDCLDSLDVVVPRKTDCPACSVSIAFTTTSPSQCGGSDGRIVALVTGITNPSFQWLAMPSGTLAGTDDTLSGIPGGLYRLVVREGSCADSSDAQLENPVPFTLAFVVDSATCSDNDGGISVQLINASASATYRILRLPSGAVVSTNQPASGLVSGNYRVVAQDGFCADSTDLVVSKPEDCTPGCTLALSAAVDSATCADNDGAITLSVTGAGSPSFSWTRFGSSFTASSQNLTGISAGVYKVVVRDGNCRDSLFVTVRKPVNCGVCNLNVIASSQPVTCNGANNGTAFAFVTSGGVGPFRYRLNSEPPVTLPEFLAAFQNQPAGPFTVAVEDQTTLCTDTVQGQIGTQISLSASVSALNPGCDGTGGAIRVTVTGGNGPFVLTLGSQTLVTADGDTTFTGLSAGTYSIQIANAQSCTTLLSNIQLFQPVKIRPVFGNITPARCAGSADGSVEIAGLAGASSYSYFITGVSPGFQLLTPGTVLENLRAGTYAMTLRGANACDLDTSFTIPAPELVVSMTEIPVPTTCQDSVGSVKISSLSGGAGGPWTLGLYAGGNLLLDGSLPSDSTLRNLPAGDYTLVLFDANACPDTSLFTIQTQQTTPVVQLTADKISICSGDTVRFTASNVAGIENPEFRWWLNGQRLNVSNAEIQLDSLEDGDSVRVSLQGIEACLNPDSALSSWIRVRVLPAGLQALATIDPVKTQACIGQSAQLKALNPNQVPSPGYRWIVNGVVLPNDTNETLTLFPGLPVNQVRLILFTRTASSCISKSRDTSDVVLVTQLESFTAVDSLRQTSPGAGISICPTTPVSFSVKSNLRGRTPFRVEWYRNDTLVSSGADTAYTFNGLVRTSIVKAVVVFDTTLSCIGTNFGNGKDSTRSIRIVVLPAGDVRCQPCSLNALVTPTNINCAGAASGAITVNATGGTGAYRYSLLPNGPSNQQFPFFFGLTPGVYSVLVRDTITGCTRTVPGITLITQNAYSVVVAAVNPTPCVQMADGKLEFVSVSDASADLGKYKFRIRPTDAYSTVRLFTGLPAGTYTMEVLDTISGCITQVVRTLTSPAALVAQAFVSSLPTCYGESTGRITLDTVLNGFGPYQYSLTGDSGTFVPLALDAPISQGFAAGSVLLYIRDLQSGCLDTVALTVGQPDSLSLSARVVIGSQCYAPTGQIKMTRFSGGTGALQLSMRLPGSNQFLPVTLATDSVLLNLIGGDFIFRLTDQNNCSKDLIINVPSNGPRAQSIQVIKPCIGDTNGIIRLSGLSGGTGPYTFSLSNNQGEILRTQRDSVFAGLRAGTYSIAMRDSSTPACEIIYTRVVEIPAPLRFGWAGATPSTCENYDGVARFVLSGGQPGYRYSFDTLARTFTEYRTVSGDTLRLNGLSARAPGDLYTLRIFDAGPDGGCAYDTIFNVPGNAPLRYTWTTRNVKCFGENSGAILLDSLNGTGPVRIRVTRTGTGELVKEDSITGTFFLNSRFEVGGLPAGSFNLQVVQYGNCSAGRSVNFSLSQPTQINIEARLYAPSADNFAMGSILLDTVRGSVAPYMVSFQEESFFNYKPDTLFEGLNPGMYSILVRDTIGCEVSRTLEVIRDVELFVPTLFTPNGDGLNDAFMIRNLPSGATLVVKNRWGSEVFKADPYQNDWEAKDNPAGTYFWYLTIPGQPGKSGWVEIQR